MVLSNIENLSKEAFSEQLESVETGGSIVDINVFQTERLVQVMVEFNESWPNEIHPFDPARQAKRTLDSSINNIRGLESNTSIQDEAVPVTDGNELVEIIRDFEEWINNNTDVRAQDSNVLLTSGAGTDASGVGYVPCEDCAPVEGDTCVVHASGFLALDNDVSAFDDYSKVVGIPIENVLVHEVGHNLGLMHEDGTSIGVKSDQFGVPKGKTLVSPMISGYALTDEYDIGPDLPPEGVWFSNVFSMAEREKLIIYKNGGDE